MLLLAGILSCAPRSLLEERDAPREALPATEAEETPTTGQPPRREVRPVPLPPSAELREINEGETLRWDLQLEEGKPTDIRGLPQGAFVDWKTGELVFQPDFIQGGKQWTVHVGGKPALAVRVLDSIQPPEPQIIGQESGKSFTRYIVEFTSDSFLDSPSRAGTNHRAVVTVPTNPSPFPVRLHLHGFGPMPSTLDWGSGSEIIVHPQDLENTYWWGYEDPGAEGERASTAPPYTMRRALHLLDWTLRTFPGDPERVHVQGRSMGGAGAGVIGSLAARHFSWVDSGVGQMIARNHRPERIEQLSGHWGSVERALPEETGSDVSVWDRMDLSRSLHEDIEAREQFFFLRHAKDDRIIHFGAVTHVSPITGESYYEALQSQRVGHFAVWDEGGHMTPDPLLGRHWWGHGWNPSQDDKSRLARNLAFPAFSQSGADADPGRGRSRDGRPWHHRAGYSGNPEVPGDTGWDGSPQGAFNRYLRWNSSDIVDEPQRFEITLGLGGASELPADGVVTNVTPRRRQSFRPPPGTQLTYRYGDQSGFVAVNRLGEFTVPSLTLRTSWQRLIVGYYSP